MNKVVVHSSYEFTGGLLYTAFSRVKSCNDIQAVGFSPNHLQSREEEIRQLEGALPAGNFDNSCSDAVQNLFITIRLMFHRGRTSAKL